MGLRVLLVDDERDLIELWCDVLASRGHEVVAADGVQRVRELVAGGLAVDVAVVDWTLPDGRGDTVLRTLRAAGLTCPVVFASGLGPLLPGDHGGQKVLPKPFRVRDLVRTVEELG